MLGQEAGVVSSKTGCQGEEPVDGPEREAWWPICRGSSAAGETQVSPPWKSPKPRDLIGGPTQMHNGKTDPLESNI